MTYNSISKALTQLASRAIRSSRFVALAVVAAFTFAAMQPAQAQSSDTWKSIAIIGGSTAAGAYIGHKVGGSTGAWIGAAAGASTGYAIDKRRRQGEYYNQDAYYNDGGYGNYGPYNGDNGGYYGNGGYNGGPYDNGGYPYPSGFQSNSYRNSSRYSGRH
jgi:hypothetical protein